jgi:hypothetical protein
MHIKMKVSNNTEKRAHRVSGRAKKPSGLQEPPLIRMHACLVAFCHNKFAKYWKVQRLPKHTGDQTNVHWMISSTQEGSRASNVPNEWHTQHDSLCINLQSEEAHDDKQHNG